MTSTPLDEQRDKARTTAVANLEDAVDVSVTAAMSLKGEENEEPRTTIVRGLADLAAAERQLGVERPPEDRFRYVARLAESERNGSRAATDVMAALQP